MEILKDASATAIYGAQGANGVVLITTKHGKSGEAKFTYDGMVAWQYQGKRIDILNLRQFAEYYNDMVAQGMATKSPALSDPSLLGKGTNWQDAIFRTALQHQHQVSAQGGTDAVKYYVSANYMNQDGTIIGSNFMRNGARVNLDAQLKPWLKLGLNATYSHTSEKPSCQMLQSTTCLATTPLFHVKVTTLLTLSHRLWPTISFTSVTILTEISSGKLLS